MWKIAVASLLASSANIAHAQDEVVQPAQVVSAAEFTQLPPEIQSALRGTNPIQILSIDGNESISNGLLFVDELIVQRGGNIVFSNLDQPYLAVVARRVRVVDAQTPFSIGRVSEWKDLDGAAGSNGPRGARGGRNGRHGATGAGGGTGGNGSPGQTFDMPPVYIVVGSIENASTGAPISQWDITYSFDGFRGGHGGKGGTGGRGGNGGKGKKWKKANPFGCGSGPGRGGNGGAGGKGGIGAAAGDGGDGSTISFFATQPVTDILTFGDINNYGGEPGIAGAKGPGGAGGRGGQSGSKGDCSSASNGRGGARGADGVAGPKNINAGARGDVFAYIARSADELFLR